MAIYRDLNGLTPSEHALLEDIPAVYASIINIISSLQGERLFRPDYPSEQLEDSLFDLMDDITSLQVFRIVTSAIEKWEPRVEIIYSKVSVTPNYDTNAYDLVLYFKVKGFGDYNYELRGQITQ